MKAKIWLKLVTNVNSDNYIKNENTNFAALENNFPNFMKNFA